MPSPDEISQEPKSVDQATALYVSNTRGLDETTQGTGPRGAESGPNVEGAGVIPGYEILGRLGKGGMGVVYRARQVSLNRIVALKLIIADSFADDEQVRRFQSEASSAARLDHPGIVPVYETGSHGGRHYYSMALVEGQSLAARLVEGPLAPREAAELTAAVAQAVHYAHQQGIVHRDLKPANILLDRDGRPRVADFGLAKQVAGDSGATATGQILGTPSYMPPEQATGRTDQIGPSADVYALGATLYHLLTGRPPFQAANVIETLRQLQQEEPVPPRALNADVAKDLETIVLKCLEKSPAARYESAEAVSHELGRFLRGESIQARPLGRAQRVWRWCRRKPLAAGLAATAAALVLLLAAGGPIVALREARLRNEAEQNYADARTAVDQYVQTVRNSTLLKDERFKPVLKDLLKGARTFYLGFAERNKNRPDRLEELADVMMDVGEIGIESGSNAEAQQALSQSIEILNRLLETRPDSSYFRDRLSDSYMNLAVAKGDVGDAAGARADLETGLKIRIELAADEPGNRSFQRDLASAYHNQSLFNYREGRLDEARADLEQALQIDRNLAAVEPTDGAVQSDLADRLLHLGNVDARMGNREAALAEYTEALAIHRQLAEQYPEEPEHQSNLALTHNNLGDAQRPTDPAAARANLERAVAILEELVRRHPTMLEYRRILGSGYRNLGEVTHELGDLSLAESNYGKALALYTELDRENPGNTEFLVELSQTQRNLGNMHYSKGDRPAAIEAYQQSLTIKRQLASDRPTELQIQQDLATTYNNLAVAQNDVGDRAGALESHQAALEIHKRSIAAYPERPELLSDLGRTYTNLAILKRATNDPAAAIEYYDQAAAIFLRLADDDPERVEYASMAGAAYSGMGLALNDLERRDEALARLEDAIHWQRKAFDAVPEYGQYRKFLANHYAAMSIVLCEMKRSAEAVDAAIVRKQLMPNDPNVLFHTACRISLCVPLVGGDKAPDQLTPEERTQRQQFTDLAVQTLREAVAAGWADLAEIAEHEDFAAIGDDPGYQALVTEVASKLTPGEAVPVVP